MKYSKPSVVLSNSSEQKKLVTLYGKAGYFIFFRQ